MKAQAKKLIAYLKRTKKVQISSYYVGSNFDWEYYYCLSGWFEAKYFCIYLFKAEGFIPENHMSSTTDCRGYIMNLFNKYSLDETR